ncbi:Xaa-Pro peptidase family protein [Colwellia sp. 4_MG-2023]|uniref:M24 family metallopeptidase n=1 Tax=unclassified Colwellia TaxID=196834 RepID=UPI001C08850F|nr:MULTISPECIES: Xaa-Pro peptidase family protein [unclassified Colwellia]MBU2924869.1 Xaa-Pro peptidase family protein [Colwellia sp. C2M11]MDO6487123.1 Xaa-Pro peptidase family protein [Colwellia sp. 6_MG-2023]MDO6505512.1 Xaa-Pro peptidase family protein [Colwellia sp. 5_MG-2023]MDO6554192.1 Xaa-Pro peptidase family protein [Colwellia sp. 4_MG-2023]MDO6650933.1 Xaa-Pro peptidase family protein [Colwellia sp. 3_MG-2023]
MTIGVGGSTPEIELNKLTDMTADIVAITEREFNERISQAQTYMLEQNIDAMYLDAGTNLTYFTGLKWYKSERLVGAILPAKGELTFIAPHFEQGSLLDHMIIQGQFNGWHEHESPYALFAQTLIGMNIRSGNVAIDESAPFFVFDGFRKAAPHINYTNASDITALCRQIKSSAEIALMQRAKDMTIAVHKAAARILTPGISTVEVTEFINEAHKRVGASGSSFCIVLFGLATSFPHGVKEPQILKENDWVLIDTGCLVQGYNSDITRTYAYGEATPEQRNAWQVEKEAQINAFNEAKLNAPCGNVDDGARAVLEKHGYGPDYQLPGLPHRTGHGCGLDIHEWPYLVKGTETKLQTGMVFSNEPMLVIPDKFGIRLEDHFYMDEQGPVWFTTPSHSIDDPFGLEV